jgi:transcriptional regulator with XRE-family HTH domain
MIKTALQIKTIGTILKEKRKELKLELKQIAEITKIRSDYLAALEEGNYAKFPSEVYLKGFLKNYAKFLGISTEKALALYRRENERDDSQTSLSSSLGSHQMEKLLVLTPNRVLTLIAGLAILIIVIYLGSYVGQVLRKPDLKLTSPVAFADEGSVAYKTDANFIEITGTVEIGSKLTINDIELKLNNFEQFTKEFNLVEGINTFVLTAVSQFGREKSITLTIQKEEQPLPTATPTPGVNELQLSVEIVDRDTQITVFIDGEKRTERLYKVGSTLEFTAKEKIELRSSRPASLKVILNSEEQPLESVITIWRITDTGIVKE